MNSPYIPNGPFRASARVAKIMSRCCRISSKPISISALTPRTPIVPSMPAIQPGAAIVNCHGSLCVIVGGTLSFGWSSSVPAWRGPNSANTAAAKKNRFIVIDPSYVRPRPNPRKLISHQSILIILEPWRPSLLAVKQTQSFCTDCNSSIGLWGYSRVALKMDDLKKIGLPIKGGRFTKLSERLLVLSGKRSEHPRLPGAASDRDLLEYRFGCWYN